MLLFTFAVMMNVIIQANPFIFPWFMSRYEAVLLFML
jgi:hypothetical protein